MIDIHELNNTRDMRFKKRIKIYNVFLKKCLQKIKSLSSEREFCTYQVPILCPGIPLFNRNKCIYYLFHKLINTGFQVYHMDNLKLLIYWGHIPSYVKEPNLIEKNKVIEQQIQTQKKIEKYRDINEHTPMIKSNFIYNINDLQKNIKKII